MEGFEQLSAAELETLQQAPAAVVALIGAADGKFDSEERTWADKLAHTLTYAANSKPLQGFYRAIADSLLDRADALLRELPGAAEARTTALTHRLEAINAILAKLDPALASGLYHSLLALAEETAKASGGFLRIGAVSNAEHHLLQLPMLTPWAKNMGREIEE